MNRQPKYKIEVVDTKTEMYYVFTGDLVRDVRTQLVNLYMEWEPTYNIKVLERLQIKKLITKIEMDFNVCITT